MPSQPARPSRTRPRRCRKWHPDSAALDKPRIGGKFASSLRHHDLVHLLSAIPRPERRWDPGVRTSCIGAAVAEPGRFNRLRDNDEAIVRETSGRSGESNSRCVCRAWYPAGEIKHTRQRDVTTGGYAGARRRDSGIARGRAVVLIKQETRRK